MLTSDSGEDRDEPLEAEPQSESLHHSLPFSDGDVGILSAIVQTFMGAMFDVGHGRADGGDIGPSLSVMMRLGRQSCFLRSSINKRLAAFVSWQA